MPFLPYFASHPATSERRPPGSGCCSSRSLTVAARTAIPEHTLSRWARAGVSLVALVAWAGCADRAVADRLPPDPVEDFRQALKQDREPIRQVNLAKKAEALKSLGDLSRALLLQEWRVDLLHDRIQQALARRFQEGAKALLTKGAVLEKAATAYLIGEMASSARSLDSSLGPKWQFLRQTIAVLGPELVRVTRDPSPRVREAAATALGKIDSDPEANELAKLANLKAVVEALDQLLADDKPGPRLAAARSLNGLVYVAAQQEKKSRGPLQLNLAIRNELFATCALVIGPATRALSANQPIHARRAAAEACQQVTASLKDRVKDLVESGGRRVQEAGPEEFRPILVAFQENIKGLAAASSDPDPGIRVQVRHVIEELAAVRQLLAPGEESIPKLDGPREGESPPDGVDPTLKAPRETLQETLRQALGALVAGLKDPNDRGRLAAIDALETLEGSASSALPDIVKRVHDRDHFVRWAAARTLGRLAPARPDLVVPAVQALLRDQDLDLRLVAAGILTRYGPAAAPAVKDLARSVRSGDPEIRIAAMKALESIGTAAELALPAMVEDLTYHNPQVRATAARTLARFGSAAAFAKPALSNALADSDPEVRRAASEALLKIDNK